MAPKKKKTKVSSDGEILDDDVVTSINDLFSAHMRDNFDVEDEDVPVSLIPSGIQLLDALAGGGFACGLTQLVGNSGCGKSALAVKIIQNAQRMFGEQFLGRYIDTEETQTSERLEQLGLRDMHPLSGMTVERLFKVISAVHTFKAEHEELVPVPSVIVWDSIANTITEKMDVAEGDSASVTGQRAKELAYHIPKNVSKMKKYNIALIGINHLRDDIQIGPVKKAPDLRYLMQNKKIPGGTAVQYNSSQILLMRAEPDIDSYGFNGFTCKCRFIKNKFFSPKIDFSLVFSFERGFSNFWTNYELLKDFKRITGASTSWKLVAHPTVSCPQYKFLDKYTEDPEFRRIFDAEVEDVIQTEYISKYKNAPVSSDEDFDDSVDMSERKPATADFF